MTALDRRAVLKGMSSGVLASLAATAGLALIPRAAEAMVLSPGTSDLGANPEDLVENARVVVVHPRRRRRRRRRICWWRRGRRVCEWRW
ncbi:hypothetical protein U8607_13375 [Methylobacterium durans]|uniref:hypothetical protein n=1 Tax=Methylobacterium durans TaxID=2202825 RepID=UPI002AFEDD35|nr:hypothetical protein [Methylobacterium durans]MEA1833073.1 hypothetical protein [Methylobacterium durans]